MLLKLKHPPIAALGLIVAYVLCFGPAAVINQRWDPSRMPFRYVYDCWIHMLPQTARLGVMAYADWWITVTGSPPLFRADLQIGEDAPIAIREFLPPGLALPSPRAIPVSSPAR